MEDEPRLARRRLNKHSKIKSGRTIGERREHLETASERLAARNKVKKRQRLRVVITVVVFLGAAAAVVLLVVNLLKAREVHEENTSTTVVTNIYTPTVPIIDEHGTTGGITARMSEYIGMSEVDFRERGLIISRAVIPAGSIREVDFYLDGHPGFIKTTIDRGTGVTAEDTDRMLRYLAGQGISEYEYIDVRIDGKAYWK